MHHAQVKARAVKEGTTVSRLIEDSIRLASALDLEARAPFELVTFGMGGSFTHLEVDRTSALIEEDDIARYGERG